MQKRRSNNRNKAADKNRSNKDFKYTKPTVGKDSAGAKKHEARPNRMSNPKGVSSPKAVSKPLMDNKVKALSKPKFENKIKEERFDEAFEKPAVEGVFGGRRAALEALKGMRAINKVFIANGEREGSIKEIIALAKEKKIPVMFVDKNKLQDLLPNQRHQGVVVSVPPVDYVEVDDILANETKQDIIIILDGIEDPHNLGAIIRTAEVVGAKGVIIPKRRGVLLTETVAKSSAGAVIHLPVARVSNLVNTVETLKEKGYWIAGADMEGVYLWQENLKQPIAIVIGNEGKGISRLLKEHCDFLVGIPMYGQISSLNASVAAGILLYEISRQNQA